MVRRLLHASRAGGLHAYLLTVSMLVLPAIAACGGSPTGKTVPQGNSAAVSGTPTIPGAGTPNDANLAPTLTMPVSRFVPTLDDLNPKLFITNPDQVFVLDANSYAKATIFKGMDGAGMLKQWGYLGGYEAGWRPEDTNVGSPDKAVLQGSYYINVEAHLFSNADGAEKMYDFFAKNLAQGGTPVEIAPIGNASSAWSFPQGIITGSSQPSIDHRLLFRRGNLVVAVRTLGAQSLMSGAQMRSVAQMIDDKALGKRPAVEPTPTSNFTPNAGVPTSSPTATR